MKKIIFPTLAILMAALSSCGGKRLSLLTIKMSYVAAIPSFASSQPMTHWLLPQR